MAVELMDFERFARSLGNVMLSRMNMSIYNGTFECACGSSHAYGSHIRLLAEGRMRVVMVCPQDSDYLTNVGIKTFMIVKFKGFESIAGFHMVAPDDRNLADSVFCALT